MPWDAFCEEHYEEAYEHIVEKFKDCDVAMIDFQQIEGEEITCGYPECENEPVREIIWMDRDFAPDAPSSEYVGLEDLD